MNSGLRFLALAGAVCSFLTLLADDRGRVALDIDALVRVAGMPSTGTEVYIIPAEGRVEHLTEGFSQFYRELELQTTYLLSFERDGCMDKQVYIDTHVPQSFMSLSPFAFRFKVTLRGQERQGDRYAGPVAFVRFNAGLSDFDYETDYRMLRDSTVFQRLELARSLGADHPALGGDVLPDAVRVPSSGNLPAVEPAVPAGSLPVVELPRKVTRVGVANAAPEPAARPAPEVVENRSDTGPKPAPAPPVGARPASLAPGFAKREHPSPRADLPADPLAEGRSEELVVEPLRVTTIVRVVLNGVTTEFRRVAHYHGGVTHFKNGSPCSEAVYHEGTGY